LKNETLAAQIRASMSSAKTLEMKQELKKSLEKHETKKQVNYFVKI